MSKAVVQEENPILNLSAQELEDLINNKWTPQARAAALLARRSKHGVHIAKEGDDPEMDLTADEAKHADENNPEYHKKMQAFHQKAEQSYRDKANRKFQWGGGLAGTAAGYVAGGALAGPSPLGILGGAVVGGMLGHKLQQKYYNREADMHRAAAEHHELRHLHLTSSLPSFKRFHGQKNKMDMAKMKQNAKTARILIDNMGYATEYVINPFVSDRQERFMWAKHPKIAQRWTDEEESKGEPVVQPGKKKRTDNSYKARGGSDYNRLDKTVKRPPKDYIPVEPVEGHGDNSKVRQEIDEQENKEYAKRGSEDVRVKGGKRGNTLERGPGNPDEGRDLDLEEPADEERQAVNAEVLNDDMEGGTIEDESEGEAVGNSEEVLAINEMIEDFLSSDVVDNTNSINEESEMRLKASDRGELVDNLVTNCDCWNGHKGSKAILNQMSDEQLIALNRAWLERQESVVTNAVADASGGGDAIETEDAPAPGAEGEEMDGNTITDDTDTVGFSDSSLPKNYQRKKTQGRPRGKATGPVTGGGDYYTGRTGMQQGDEYLDEGFERDISDTSDDHYEGDNQPARNAARLNAWLEQIGAPPFVRNMFREGQAADVELKANLIEAIVANTNNPFTEEQLEAMTTNQLKPLAKLAGVTMNTEAPQQGQRRPAPPARRNPQQVANRVATFLSQGGKEQVQNAEDDNLVVPTINNWTEEETRMAKFKRQQAAS